MKTLCRVRLAFGARDKPVAWRPLPILAAAIVVASPSIGASNDDLHLPSPTFPEAIQLWHDGQTADALGVLDRQLAPASDDQPLEALVLRARLLGEAGRPAEAERLWGDVIGRETWMRTFSRRALVQSLGARGEPGQADPVLVELTRSDASRHLDLVVDVADRHRGAGDTQRAARLYRQVLAQQRRGVWADAARLGFSATLELDGDREAALSLLRQAKLLHRQGDTFQRAQREERRLADALGQLPSPLGQDQYRTLVGRLRNASRFGLALLLIEEWRAAYPSTDRPDRVEAERIATLYAQRANVETLTACRRFYEQFPASPLVPDIRLTDFRLAVRMGDTDRARRSGLDLWQGRVPSTTDHEQSAAELLAAYLVAVGDVAGGLSLYRELFQASQSADDQRAYLWRAGIAALRSGQNDRALANLRGLVRRNPSGDLAPAGLYWLGRAEAQAEAGATAIRTFRTVVERFPYHYYGMRAREQLMQLTNGRENATTRRSLEFPSLEVTRASQERGEYKAAMVLARAGLVDDAAWYLRRLLDGRRQDRGLALLTARASAAANDYASVARIVINHFGAFLLQPARGLPHDFWELVYPRPFWDAIRTAASSADVDPVLLLSLMRQESRFDPEARSPVGAIGLFQIMPYTAEDLAAGAGVAAVVDGGVDEGALAEPAVNSAIAATLTGNLLEMFDDAIAPVIASYNAGEERVAIWWSAARQLSEDFFVDTIPYSETRRFVREVMANYAGYQRVYDDQ